MFESEKIQEVVNEETDYWAIRFIKFKDKEYTGMFKFFKILNQKMKQENKWKFERKEILLKYTNFLTKIFFLRFSIIFLIKNKMCKICK